MYFQETLSFVIDFLFDFSTQHNRCLIDVYSYIVFKINGISTSLNTIGLAYVQRKPAYLRLNKFQYNAFIEFKLYIIHIIVTFSKSSSFLFSIIISF